MATSGDSTMPIQSTRMRGIIAAALVVNLTGLFCLATSGDDDTIDAKKTVAAGPDARGPASGPTLDDLIAGRLEIVDLGWPLNDKGPHWPAENYEPFRLKTIATLETNGVLSKFFASPEHLGTHLDAPNHFEKGQPSVDQIDPRNLFAQGVVVDVSTQSDADADYRLTEADLEDWERRHGRIPEGALVLLKTGWGRFWENPARFRNQDVSGKMHFPGYSVEAARWLLAKRRVKGLGIDTLDRKS